MKTILFKFYLIALIFVSTTDLKAQWTELGGLNGLSANWEISSICSDASGNIYAGGQFLNGSGNRYVAKWNGTTWSELGGANSLAENNMINTICSDAIGNVYAAGEFGLAGSGVVGNRTIAKWDGSTWIRLIPQMQDRFNLQVNSVCTSTTGKLYAGGDFTNGILGSTFPGPGNSYVAVWNNFDWVQVGGNDPIVGNVKSFCSGASGNIYAAGSFKNSSGNCYVAKWNGSNWSELGGLNGLAANDAIMAICKDASGNIYAAGRFKNSSGNYYVAKWNGTSWSELGNSNFIPHSSEFYYMGILSLCVDQFGNVYAAGNFKNNSGKRYVAKWDGTSWSELGGLDGLAANDYIKTICSDPSGNIYAAGMFKNSSGKCYVAKFNSAIGIDEKTNNESVIRVYPNPTQSSINVKTEKKYVGENYILYDENGKVVLSGNVNSENITLELNHLSAGNYFLKIGNNTKQTLKLIKE